MRKRLFTILPMIMLSILSSIPIAASAYIDNGNGTVTLEYGDSFGEVAGAYGMNYYNLGYANGVNVDEYVCQAGDVITLAESSANSYYSGVNDGSTTPYTYNDGDYTWYGGNSSSQYTQNYNDNTYCQTNEYVSSYTDYSDSYYNENYYSDQSCSDNSYVEYYESIPIATGGYGSASIAVGYGGNAGYNVEVACSLNNNIVIPSGGTYRASDYIGSGSYDMGFVDATCLNSDGTTFDAPGGGICPVTTTIYMAGKKADLTIIEANPHNAGNGNTGVSYATAENQAMYNYGTSDLIMVNNTGHDITLTCSYVNGNINANWNL